MIRGGSPARARAAGTPTVSRPARGMGLIAKLRNHPSLAAEVLALHAVSLVAPGMGRVAGSRASGRPLVDPCAVIERSIGVGCRRAARDGVITGTAFVAGYPAALASLYMTQAMMILEIAAVHGHDPAEPVRVAEMLVIRGRHATLREALDALAAASGQDRPGDRGWITRRGRPALRHPAVWARGRLSDLRAVPVLDLVLAVMGVASFVIPFIGAPACSWAAARATRRLGQRADLFYAGGHSLPGCSVDFALPPAPSRRDEILATASVVAMVVIGLLLSSVWVGDGHQGLWRVGLVVLWVFVLGAYVRLGLVLRTAADRVRARSSSSAPAPSQHVEATTRGGGSDAVGAANAIGQRLTPFGGQRGVGGQSPDEVGGLQVPVAHGPVGVGDRQALGIVVDHVDE